LSFIFCLLTLPAWAQQPDRPLPQGSFKKDSVKIGEIISYSLAYRYPSSMEVIFPDSTFDYAPFEYVGKIFHPTRSDSAFSLDSVIYLLRTFEVEKVQWIGLPVFVLQGGDTVFIPASPDSVGLQEMVKAVTDPLSLQQQTSLLPIGERFNYPYLLVGAAAAVALLLLIWRIFGANILINYKLYTLKKDHAQFLSRYNVQAERFRRSKTLANMEKAVSLWKSYLTKLEDRAINSFTTKEISVYYNEDEDVSMALKLCDRAIYGNIITNEASESSQALSLLQNFALQRYTLIRERTRNAATTRRNL
jgi:hypothetical protein